MRYTVIKGKENTKTVKIQDDDIAAMSRVTKALTEQKFRVSSPSMTVLNFARVPSEVNLAEDELTDPVRAETLIAILSAHTPDPEGTGNALRKSLGVSGELTKSGGSDQDRNSPVPLQGPM